MTTSEAKKISRGKILTFWVLIALFLLGLPLTMALRNRRNLEKENLVPHLGQVPEFALTDEKNQKFSRDDLGTHVWVVNFIFTSCAETCPNLTRVMARVQEHIVLEHLNGVKLLSFTVDPERDTPERLKTYAASFGADPKIWTFLTGNNAAVEKTIVEGFKIAMGKAASEEKPTIFEIVHGEKFVLLDSQQNIRGYFDVTDASSGQTDLARLFAALDILERESRIATSSSGEH